jgi:hypothetical protein
MIDKMYLNSYNIVQTKIILTTERMRRLMKGMG